MEPARFFLRFSKKITDAWGATCRAAILFSHLYRSASQCPDSAIEKKLFILVDDVSSRREAARRLSLVRSSDSRSFHGEIHSTPGNSTPFHCMTFTDRPNAGHRVVLGDFSWGKRP
jgi:hypothetical protein